MNFLERFRKDRETLHNLPKEKRMEFIWDYYKMPIIVVICVISLIIITLMTNIGRGDVSMYAVLINAKEQPGSHVFEDLLTSRGMDMDGKHVSVSANYTLGTTDDENTDISTVQVLAALFGVGDLDLFAANQKVFDSYATQNAFVDISLFVEPEVLKARERDLYRYKDPSGNEIVGGVWLRNGSPLHRAGYYSEDVLIGAAANAEHLEEAVEVLKAILEEP